MSNLDDNKVIELMKLAVETMHRSITEPRTDKVSPKVGAVLLKTDGTIETAARGELRYGDHAEFTLLERKNRSELLDGGILFATLEPCAPGARSHPKLGCAERIVNARISEVWIGIEDPDPTVNRKGLKYLEDNGIVVHMFSREFQNEIKKANKAFLEGALIRAAEDKIEKEIKLSNLDNELPYANLKDFSKEAIQYYIDETKLDFEPFSEKMNRHFESLELIKRETQADKEVFVPTGFGILLFGKKPRDKFQHAVVKTKVVYGSGKPIAEDFEGALVLVPNKIEKWLQKTLHSSTNRDDFKRREETNFPIEPLREAIINALVHRDYDIEGAKTNISIDDDKIVIRSAGAPVSPIELNDVLHFRAPSLSRNPKITYIFNQMGLMEEGEIGMDTFSSMQEKYQLPLPQYDYKAPYLSLTFYRDIAAFRDAKISDLLNDLNDEEVRGLNWIKVEQEVSSSQYAEQFKFSQKKAQRQLANLVENNFIELKGRGKSAVYHYIEKKETKF